MKKKKIQILGLNKLFKFVLEASKVEGDVLVHRGKFCADGKSLMNMMSINFSDVCYVEYPKDAIKFEKYLKQVEI